jgi:hypothetical protein
MGNARVRHCDLQLKAQRAADSGKAHGQTSAVQKTDKRVGINALFDLPIKTSKPRSFECHFHFALKNRKSSLVCRGNF